jgi:hypothetical protein
LSQTIPGRPNSFPFILQLSKMCIRISILFLPIIIRLLRRQYLELIGIELIKTLIRYWGLISKINLKIATTRFLDECLNYSYSWSKLVSWKLALYEQENENLKSIQPLAGYLDHFVRFYFYMSHQSFTSGNITSRFTRDSIRILRVHRGFSWFTTLTHTVYVLHRDFRPF